MAHRRSWKWILAHPDLELCNRCESALLNERRLLHLKLDGGCLDALFCGEKPIHASQYLAQRWVASVVEEDFEFLR